MSEGAMIPASRGKYATPTALAKAVKVGDYLPYIVTGTSSTGVVKEGKLPMGHFGLVEGKTVHDLTKEFQCILLAVRPKAMQFSPNVVSVYDPESPTFLDIDSRSKVQNSGCAAGVEYLVWLPEYEKFAGFFFSTVSAKNEVPNVQAYLDTQEQNQQWTPCTFTCELMRNKKNQTWHSMVVGDCDAEITNLPPYDLMNEVVEKFNNPPAEPETASAPQNDRD